MANLAEKFKNTYKSMTIWLNTVALTALGLSEIFKESLQELGQFLGPDTFKVLGLIVLFSNIALRFKTNKSLADK